MQRLNWESIGKYKKYYLVAFSILILCFRTRIYACELELEQNIEDEAEKDIAHFNIQYSKAWTSKGREILSYDVSENGSILIAFPDRKVGVFDKNMNFLFELSFQGSGAYGALWYGENILLVNIRGDTAVECDMSGKAVNSYIITGPGSYYYSIAKRRRKYDEYEYYCTNNSWDGGDMSYEEYYTILKRMSSEDGEEILYKSGNLLDGVQYTICIILLFGLAFIGIFLLLAALDSKSTKILDGKPFDGTRTYSTAYSVDDCIGLLSRKNIYDVLLYSFRQEKEDTWELVVMGHNKFTRLQMKVCHQVVFGENGNTKIRIKNLSGEKINPYSYIPQWWMDEFMEQKLDALPVDAEADKNE